jgi:hypothetical protein
MKAVVVYESLWGNTAAIAAAIAEGIGEGAEALATDAASPALIADADLIVAGSPLLGFALPTEEMRKSIGADTKAPPADLAHPSMRAWLDSVPATTTARCCGFETRIWWSPGSAAKKISQTLASKGFRAAGKPEAFIVTGRYGPLKDGELDRARAWGAALAQALG